MRGSFEPHARCGSSTPGTMTDDYDGAAKRVRAPSLLKFPGESPVLHTAVQWWESTQTKLATMQLLKSANGKTPDAADRIRDLPLTEIPSLPVGDRDHHRREELRIATRRKNAINRMDRHRIIMSERTAVFSALYESAEESAPMFARELKEACDYSRLDGSLAGYFDGSLAYSLTYSKLFKAKRTQSDVGFYDAAKQIQKKTVLGDGCKSGEFMAKAHMRGFTRYVRSLRRRIHMKMPQSTWRK